MTKPHKDVLDSILKEHLKQCFINDLNQDPYLSKVFEIIKNHMSVEEALICIHEISHIPQTDSFYTVMELRDDRLD